MALQCAQLPITISAGFDKTPKAVANYRKSFYGSSSQAGLKNSNFTLQARFLRHCKRDVSKPTFIEMTPITGEAQFDAALESGNPVIIDWCSLSPHSLPPVSCLDWFHLQMHLSM
jgi:hypothetical protein